MAGEQESQVAQSGQTAASSQSSSTEGSQSGQAASTQDAASQQTQSSQAGTTDATASSQTAQATAGTRPEGVPDLFWDAEKNTFKADVANELATFKAAQDSRTASLPQTPDAYQLTLPEGFKPPDGIDLKFDANDPNFKAAQAMAHAKGWTQQDFSDALGIVGMMEANKAAAFETAKTANLAELGANATKRIEALVPWITAEAGEKDAKGIIATLVTAGHVRFFEKLLGKVTSQGNASFTTRHRVPADDPKVIPNWDKMSFEQRRLEQDKRAGRAS